MADDAARIAQLEAENAVLRERAFEVNQLVREVEAMLRPLVDKNGNALIVACPDDVGTMHADQTKVRQALFNLLSSAAKFTDHGTITLRAALTPGPRSLPRARGSQRAWLPPLRAGEGARG